MIGKAKSNKSLQATLAYNVREKAELIFTNRLQGESLADYRMQMEDLQHCYRGYGKQLTIHTILSPAIENGKKLTAEQWQQVAGRYLQEMNMQGLQALGFVHTDKEHKHLHLVVNKVQEEGFGLYHDSFIGKRSQQAADRIATAMKLVRAMEIKQQRLNAAAGLEKEQTPEGAKQQFKVKMEKELKNHLYFNIDDYFDALRQAGFKVHAYRQKETGELRGYGIEMGGTKMDASSVGRQFTLKALRLVDGKGVEQQAKPKETEKVVPLRDKGKKEALLEYANRLGINRTTIQQDPSLEMVAMGNHYFLAMKTDSGGYALNNVYSKTFSGNRDITTKFTGKGHPTVIVGDVLDYLQHKQHEPGKLHNYIILHDSANIGKATEKIKALGLTIAELTLMPGVGNDALLKEISEAVREMTEQKEEKLLEREASQRQRLHI